MITKSQANNLFLYDGSRGCLINKTTRHYLARKGTIAGSRKQEGYWDASVMGKKYYIHHIVWLMHYGEIPSTIDHINGDRSDNRIENLRQVTRQQNSWNSKPHSDGTSGFKGVSFHKASGLWHSRICVSGKTKHLGLFTTAAKAHDAYVLAATKIFGEFARAA